MNTISKCDHNLALDVPCYLCDLLTSTDVHNRAYRNPSGFFTLWKSLVGSGSFEEFLSYLKRTNADCDDQTLVYDEKQIFVSDINYKTLPQKIKSFDKSGGFNARRD